MACPNSVLVAGLTTGAVIIPKAMAYAMMSGLLVQVGLYTALVPINQVPAGDGVWQFRKR